MTLDFINDINKENSIFKSEFYDLIEKIKEICIREKIQVRIHENGSYIIEK
jgi:hypothetical protein